MEFRREPLDYYVGRLKNNQIFSMGLYGDGEARAIQGDFFGESNALGEVYSLELCTALRETLKPKDGFLYGTDENLIPWIDKVFKKSLGEDYIENDWYDGVVWDRAARLGELGPFIKQLQRMNVVIVGNKHLRELKFLNYGHFIEVSEVNCFNEMPRIIEECQKYNQAGVYLIAVGLPASYLAYRLHGTVVGGFFIDVGGAFDLFVGRGLQRGWRKELWDNKQELEKWRIKNLGHETSNDMSSL